LSQPGECLDIAGMVKIWLTLQIEILKLISIFASKRGFLEKNDPRKVSSLPAPVHPPRTTQL
jgi:hypothetical protein